RPIGAADGVQLGFGRAAPAHADDVQTDQRTGLAECKAEWNNIVTRGRHARHHHTFANADELMDGDVAAKEGEIADADMTAEHGVVGERNVIADMAVVTDMRTDHEE